MHNKLNCISINFDKTQYGIYCSLITFMCLFLMFILFYYYYSNFYQSSRDDLCHGCLLVGLRNEEKMSHCDKITHTKGALNCRCACVFCRFLKRCRGIGELDNKPLLTKQKKHWQCKCDKEKILINLVMKCFEFDNSFFFFFFFNLTIPFYFLLTSRF